MCDQESVKRINITASTSYEGPQTPVHVNSNTPMKLSADGFEVHVIVRIRDYVNDQVDSEMHEDSLSYFDSDLHKNDSFSVQFTVTFNQDIRGEQLKWGNDWDHPIRDILPWGFSAAFASFKYAIDPGVDGDPYADKPWVYGSVLSSINYMEKVEDDIPPESIKGPIEEPDAKSRYKKFLDKETLKNFVFKKGETYVFDFSSPYLDMSTTPKIKLPGFTFDVGKYAGMTKLRYVLKCDDELVFALTFEADRS